jgi:hypothetical protein
MPALRFAETLKATFRYPRFVLEPASAGVAHCARGRNFPSRFASLFSHSRLLFGQTLRSTTWSNSLKWKCALLQEIRLTNLLSKETRAFTVAAEHYPLIGKHGYRWKISQKGHYLGSVELGAEVTLPDDEIKQSALSNCA